MTMRKLTDDQIQLAVNLFEYKLRNMVIEDLDELEIENRVDKNIQNFYAVLEEQNRLMRDSKVRLLTTQERGIVESFDDNPWADNYVREIYHNQSIVREKLAEALIK